MLQASADATEFKATLDKAVVDSAEQKGAYDKLIQNSNLQKAQLDKVRLCLSPCHVHCPSACVEYHANAVWKACAVMLTWLSTQAF